MVKCVRISQKRLILIFFDIDIYILIYQKTVNCYVFVTFDTTYIKKYLKFTFYSRKSIDQLIIV